MFYPFSMAFQLFTTSSFPKKAIVEERLGKQLGKGTGSDDKAGESTFCRVKGCILWCIYNIIGEIWDILILLGRFFGMLWMGLKFFLRK